MLTHMAASHAIRHGLNSTIKLLAVRKSLRFKWVFRYIYVSNLEKPQYKAWLVAKAFKQEHGVDFDEIFSPIVKMTTLRLLLRVLVTKNLELEQLNVKTSCRHWRYCNQFDLSLYPIRSRAQTIGDVVCNGNAQLDGPWWGKKQKKKDYGSLFSSYNVFLKNLKAHR